MTAAPSPEISQLFITAQQRLDLLDPLHELLFRCRTTGQPFRLVPNGFQPETQRMESFAARLLLGRLDQPFKVLHMLTAQDLKPPFINLVVYKRTMLNNGPADLF